jgi:hypothetical protein
MPVAAAPAPAPAPQAVAPRPLAEPAAGLRIPAKAMSAYRKAEQTMATAAPGCGISWNLLAGIGRIEAAAVGGGATAVRSVYARPTAPAKFISATWSRFASDGDSDGKSDSKNPFDATLATAKHLCSSGMNFRNQSQALKALLRYNDSMAFAANVLGWAAAYSTGTSPLNLPPIYGPVPVLPYLPGSFWALAGATQAGYLLPAPAAENPVPALSAVPPVVVVPPEPAPMVEVPIADAAVAPVAAPGQAAVGSAVAPQLALQGDRPRAEPTEAFSAPPPPAPAPLPPAPQVPEPQLPELQLPPPEPPAVPESLGRQAGRAQADMPVQASGGSDGGGESRSGGARRGGRG